MKNITEYVWPEEKYTDKIAEAIKVLFCEKITFRPVGQNEIYEFLIKTFKWLTLDTKPKKQLLHKIVNTSIRKYIQQGILVEANNDLTGKCWCLTKIIEESPAFKQSTTKEEVLQNTNDTTTFNKIKNRAISQKELDKANKLGH